MHLRGERKEREAAAFSDLLYKKDTILHTEKPLQLAVLLFPWDENPLCQNLLESFLSATFTRRCKTLCTATERKYEA